MHAAKAGVYWFELLHFRAEGSSCSELLFEFNPSGNNLKLHSWLTIQLFAHFLFSFKLGGLEITEVGEHELGLEEICSALFFAFSLGKGLEPPLTQSSTKTAVQLPNTCKSQQGPSFKLHFNLSHIRHQKEKMDLKYEFYSPRTSSWALWCMTTGSTWSIVMLVIWKMYISFGIVQHYSALFVLPYFRWNWLTLKIFM